MWFVVLQQKMGCAQSQPLDTRGRTPSAVAEHYVWFPIDSSAGIDMFRAAFKEELISNSVLLISEIDHAALAVEHTSASLRPTHVLFFGKPEIGTPLMDAHPQLSLELPLRLALWQDGGSCVTACHPNYEHVFQTLGSGSAGEAMNALIKKMVDGATRRVQAGSEFTESGKHVSA